MVNDSLVKLIDFWQEVAQEKGLLSRRIIDDIDIKTKEIVDIVGPRRSGKSSVMKLLLQKLKTKGNCLYINFEDPYFIEHDTPLVIEELVETYKAYFYPRLTYLFFDEIQNISSWEKAVRKLRDSGRYKIFISGSSSKLLGSELATLLSGRHLSYQLLPLSFEEYLAFHSVTIQNRKDLLVQEKVLLKHFREYLDWGGFPEVVLSKKRELLKQYFVDMIQRDIVKRYQIRERAVLEKMGMYLITNSAKIISVSSLKNLYTISHELASTYMEYFKDAFLVFKLPQFAYSVKTQQKALKKIYAVDTGLANVVSFRFSQDKGRMLETCVFLALKRLGKEIYYYKTGPEKEIDFLIKENNTWVLIQVAWSIEDEKTRKRELTNLTRGMDEMKLKKGLLLTYDSRDDLRIDNKHILIRPLFHWLLTRVSQLSF